MTDKKNNSDDRFITPSRRADPAVLRELKKILAARIRMLVCIATLPVYIVGVWLLLSNGRSINSFLLFYCVIWTVFALDMMLRKCPACKEQFFVKEILMSFRTTRCVHCGLDKNAIESEGRREF